MTVEINRRDVSWYLVASYKSMFIQTWIQSSASTALLLKLASTQVRRPPRQALAEATSCHNASLHFLWFRNSLTATTAQWPFLSIVTHDTQRVSERAVRQELISMS